jgi:hypothetical protein
MRSSLIVVPVVAAAVAAVVIGFNEKLPVVNTAVSAASNQGKFSNVCFYSGTNNDDAIIFPRQPGKSHQHDYIGAENVDANSTLQTLQAGTTNCEIKEDLAAYWVPTLLKGAMVHEGMSMGGTPIHPSSITTYYLSNGKEKVQPYPLGLKEIAGNAKATSPDQAGKIAWGCSTSFPDQVTAPTCPAKENLHVRVFFPDCWNGKDLDSADHVSHVAYSDGKGKCPSGFPVPVPQLSLLVKYNTSGGPDISVSSGKTYSMHGDFVNAWDPKKLKELVDTCLVPGKKCGKP